MRTASLSAQLIVPSRPWRMTRIQSITDSDPARPPDGNHPFAWHATPAMLLWSVARRRTAGHVVGEATVERWMGAARTTRRSRRSGQAEDRAQPDRGRIRADDVYPEYWRSTHLSDDGRDTPRASGHCMCDLHMHMYRYNRAEVVLTRFGSIRFQRCR